MSQSISMTRLVHSHPEQFNTGRNHRQRIAIRINGKRTLSIGIHAIPWTAIRNAIPYIDHRPGIQGVPSIAYRTSRSISTVTLLSNLILGYSFNPVSWFIPTAIGNSSAPINSDHIIINSRVPYLYTIRHLGNPFTLINNRCHLRNIIIRMSTNSVQCILTNRILKYPANTDTHIFNRTHRGNKFSNSRNGIHDLRSQQPITAIQSLYLNSINFAYIRTKGETPQLKRSTSSISSTSIMSIGGTYCIPNIIIRSIRHRIPIQFNTTSSIHTLITSISFNPDRLRQF